MFGDDMFNLGAMIEGVDEDEGYMVDGPEDVESFIGAALRSRDPRDFLRTMSSAKIGRRMLGQHAGQMLNRLSSISRQVLVQTGRIEAEYIRRPNTLASVYGTQLAPGASVSFSVTPGIGNSYYRILGFICDDNQATVFGFTSLRVGGQEHVSFTQSAPAAPVSNAVPWSIFALKEGRLVTNLAPWTGQVFDQTAPITGTIANMYVAGDTGAVTATPRIVLLTQTDPCGYRYTQLADNSRGVWKSLRRNIGAYAPLVLR